MFIWNVELAWNFNKRRLHSSPYVGHLKLCAEERRDLLAFKAVWFTKKGSVVTRIYIQNVTRWQLKWICQQNGRFSFWYLGFFFLVLPRCHFLLCFAMIQVDILYSIINMQHSRQHYVDLLLFLFDSISEIDEIATVTRKRPVSRKSINFKS